MHLRASLRELLERLRGEGARIAAYGAAAKGATLLKRLRSGSELVEFVVDRNAHKQGRHMPGMHQPIRPPEALLEERPDYVLLLAWNFGDEVLAQQRDFRAARRALHRPVPCRSREHCRAPLPGLRRRGDRMCSGCSRAALTASTSGDPCNCGRGDPDGGPRLSARGPRARRLRRCGFVANPPGRRRCRTTGARHEETQGFSPRFQAFSTSSRSGWSSATTFAARTCSRSDAGKGEFLVELCELGGNRGIGIDPALRRPGAARASRLGPVRRPHYDGHEARARPISCSAGTRSSTSGPSLEFVRASCAARQQHGAAWS